MDVYFFLTRRETVKTFLNNFFFFPPECCDAGYAFPPHVLPIWQTAPLLLLYLAWRPLLQVNPITISRFRHSSYCPTLNKILMAVPPMVPPGTESVWYSWLVIIYLYINDSNDKCSHVITTILKQVYFLIEFTLKPTWHFTSYSHFLPNVTLTHRPSLVLFVFCNAYYDMHWNQTVLNLLVITFPPILRYFVFILK